MAKKLEGTDFKQDNSFETSAQNIPKRGNIGLKLQHYLFLDENFEFREIQGG